MSFKSVSSGVAVRYLQRMVSTDYQVQDWSNWAGILWKMTLKPNLNITN